MAGVSKHEGKGVVVINGRQYSAKTGRPLDGHTVIDGVSRGGHASPRHKQPAKTAHAVHHRPQPTNQPAADAAKRISLHASKPIITPVDALKAAAEELRQGVKLDAEREHRAHQIHRSNKISRFSSFAAAEAVPKQEVAKAEPPPEPPKEPAAAAEPQSQVLTLADIAQQNEEIKAAKKPKRARRKAHAKRRGMSTAAAVVAVLALSGYMLYLNIPNLALRVAASRSGIDAQLPGYQPGDFAFSGPVSYGPGYIALNFHSTNDDGRQFQLAQRKSDWDSRSLLENYVRGQSEDYETYHERGLTVYVYDDSNAAWVNGGIFYTLEGNSRLESDQILKIAASL